MMIAKTRYHINSFVNDERQYLNIDFFFLYFFNSFFTLTKTCINLQALSFPVSLCPVLPRLLPFAVHSTG